MMDESITLGALEGNESESQNRWDWVTLGEVCRDISDGSHFTPKYISNGVPFLSVKDIRENKISFANCRYISKDDHENLCKRSKPEKGDVLYTKVGTTGIAKLIDTDREFSIFVSVALLKFKANIFPEYIEKVLNSPICKVQAKNLTQGMANRNLVLRDIKQIRFPLPSFYEQERIVKILNGQLKLISQARVATEAQLAAAKALPAAYLRAVFESPEAREWPRKRLGDIGEIVSGITLGRKTNATKIRKVPYLRVANVKDGRLDLSDVNFIDATEYEIEKLRLKFGDILLTEGGDPDKLGRGTYWTDQIPDCIHQNHIFRVRFDLNTFLPQFLSYQIGSNYGKSYFLAHAKRTTGIATINQKVLGNFPLMISDFSEQKNIVFFLNKKLNSVSNLIDSLERQLSVITKFPSSLLRSAFNGDL